MFCLSKDFQGFAVYSSSSNQNKWSKNSYERLHSHLVTPSQQQMNSSDLDYDPHLIHGSLAPVSQPQTAHRALQLLLHTRQQSLPMHFNGANDPAKFPLLLRGSESEPHLIHGSLASTESACQTASWSIQPTNLTNKHTMILKRYAAITRILFIACDATSQQPFYDRYAG